MKTNYENPDRLLTIDDLASILNVQKSYIYRINHENRGPKVLRFGSRTIRYRMSDVQEWLNKQVDNNDPREVAIDGML